MNLGTNFVDENENMSCESWTWPIGTSAFQNNLHRTKLPQQKSSKVLQVILLHPLIKLIHVFKKHNETHSPQQKTRN